MHDAPTRTALGLKATYQERKCLESLESLTSEASGRGFGGWFLEWVSQNGLALADLGIPETIIGLLDPANSLQLKTKMAGPEGVCATWWYHAKQGRCST